MLNWYMLSSSSSERPILSWKLWFQIVRYLAHRSDAFAIVWLSRIDWIPFLLQRGRIGAIHAGNPHSTRIIFIIQLDRWRHGKNLHSTCSFGINKPCFSNWAWPVLHCIYFYKLYNTQLQFSPSYTIGYCSNYCNIHFLIKFRFSSCNYFVFDREPNHQKCLMFWKKTLITFSLRWCY